MTERLVAVFVCALVVLFVVSPSSACSTFCLEAPDGPVFGKNYDWDVDAGLLVVNKRALAKVAMTDDNPARWASRYGSVTFNQYGRELPSGGINEMGLVVELMWMDETRYPAPDDRPTVTTLQWIQYQLDNCATVGEVIATDTAIRVTSAGTAPIHFLVADRAGACAAIEFIDGKLAAHIGDSMPFRALTNSTYERSAASMQRRAGYGGDEPLGHTNRSLDRFARAADMVSRYDASAQSPVEYAFSILGDVAQGAHTKWSIVYDIGAMRVHFKTRANQSRRWLDITRLDFECVTPTKIVDLNAPVEGDLGPRLTPYTRQANLETIVESFGRTSFLRDVPRDALEELSRYPEETVCTPRKMGDE